MSVLVSREPIEQVIFLIRGHRVMLDSDLAKLYGVTTFNLNKAVKRNRDRFPEDFMFWLSAQETAALTFQIGISKPRGRGGRREEKGGEEKGVRNHCSLVSPQREQIAWFPLPRRIPPRWFPLQDWLIQLSGAMGRHSHIAVLYFVYFLLDPNPFLTVRYEAVS